MTACFPLYPIIPRDSLWPHWNEWVCIIWVAGLILVQLTSPQDRAGFGMIKLVIIGVNVLAISMHIASFFMDKVHSNDHVAKGFPWGISMGDSHGKMM